MAQAPPTLSTSRRIPAERAATYDELTAAINGLTRHELFKLKKAAGYRVRGLGRMAAGRDWQDLLNETVLAFYRPDGRKWKKDEVDIIRTLTEAMRSVADNWKRSFDEDEARLESELITTSESGQKSNPYAEYPDPNADLHADLEAAAHHAEIAEKISRIEKIVETRERAALIVMGMKDGLTGPELKKELEISQNELETEMTWIRRNVRAAFKDRS